MCPNDGAKPRAAKGGDWSKARREPKGFEDPGNRRRGEAKRKEHLRKKSFPNVPEASMQMQHDAFKEHMTHHDNAITIAFAIQCTMLLMNKVVEHFSTMFSNVIVERYSQHSLITADGWFVDVTPDKSRGKAEGWSAHGSQLVHAKAQKTSRRRITLTGFSAFHIIMYNLHKSSILKSIGDQPASIIVVNDVLKITVQPWVITFTTPIRENGDARHDRTRCDIERRHSIPSLEEDVELLLRLLKVINQLSLQHGWQSA